MTPSTGRVSRRYLLVTNGLARGGAETQTVRLAVELVERGHQVRLLSILPTQAFADQVAAAGIAIHELNDDLTPGIARLVPTLKGAVADIRTWRPEVVISFVYQANLLTRLVGLVARDAVIISSVRNENFGGSLRDLSIRLTDRLADATTTNSERAADRLRENGLVSSGRLHVIPNALDIAAFTVTAEDRAAKRAELGLAEEDFAWLAVGRLSPQKDFGSLVRAVALMASDEGVAPSAPRSVLIAGIGPEEPALRREIDDAGMDGIISLLGGRSDVPELMGAADALVLSSAWEGLPNVVMEAMAAGLPVVATDVGGVRELVDDSNGRVVAPGDFVVLSGGMESIEMLSKAERAALGDRGRDRIAATYQTSVVVDRWESLAEDHLAAKKRSAR